MAYKNSEEEGLAVAGCKGQPATAKAPCKGAAGHGQPRPPCRGGRLQPRPPCKGAAGHLQGAATRGRGWLRSAHRGDCQRRTCKGRSSTASPQEATYGALARSGRQRPARKRLPTARLQGAAANRGGGSGRRGGRPLARRLPIVTRSATACAGATAATQEGEVEG
ncbi:hypothetical protein BHE74_00038579 [Ensete ventricosum]|nr:hypothetical protein BHE74_00038579 [Ensete ventricosum]